jgi:hypothetical protein
MATCIDEICMDVSRAIGIDLFVVRESVTSWLAKAADALDEQGVVDLAELGRIHQVKLAKGDGEAETITVHRPHVDPMTGYHGIRFDEYTKIGPVQALR